MRTKNYVYNEKVVEFFIDDDIMVNATEMGRVFNQKTYAFLRLESTKKWINWLENNPIRSKNSAIGEKRSVNSAPRSAKKQVLPGEIKHRSADLVPILIINIGGDDGGVTYMHRLLAIDFAMWLDVSFKGWIIQHIDNLLFDYSLGKMAINIEKRNLKTQLDKMFKENATDTKILEIQKILGRQQQLKGDEFNLNIDFKRKFED